MVARALRRTRRLGEFRHLGHRHRSVGPEGPQARRPPVRLLGGHDPDVQAYAGSINFNFSIPELIEQNRQLVDSGFHAVKMRVGKETLREDIERVGAVRNEIGPDVHLMVDANMKWSAEEAIRRSRALAQHDVYWLEEPTIPDDVAGHARIVAEA